MLGVNFNLVFAAMLEMTSSKLIFALVHLWGVPARHGDVPNAYVKAATEEGIEILLYVPNGLNLTVEEFRKLGVSSIKEVALCLERSLYGLRQAGRLWHEHLHRALKSLGFANMMKVEKL